MEEDVSVVNKSNLVMVAKIISYVSSNLMLSEVQSMTVGLDLPCLLLYFLLGGADMLLTSVAEPLAAPSVVLLWQGAEAQRIFKRFTWRDREEQATGSWGGRRSAS
jgi:hypothetical protein